MPPAKTPATRRASQGAASRSGTQSISREEVEQAAARFDQVLEEATQVLQTMRRNLGRNAGTAYKDVANGLKSLRRDARTTNRTLIKDLDKLRSSLAKATPSRLTAGGGARAGAARSGTRARSGAARASGTTSAGTARSGSARGGTARTTAARKPAAAKGRAAGSAAGKARSAAKPKASSARTRAAGSGSAPASTRGSASSSRGAAKTGGARSGSTARSRTKRS